MKLAFPQREAYSCCWASRKMALFRMAGSKTKKNQINKKCCSRRGLLQIFCIFIFLPSYEAERHLWAVLFDNTLVCLDEEAATFQRVLGVKSAFPPSKANSRSLTWEIIFLRRIVQKWQMQNSRDKDGSSQNSSSTSRRRAICFSCLIAQYISFPWGKVNFISKHVQSTLSPEPKIPPTFK